MAKELQMADIFTIALETRLDNLSRRIDKIETRLQEALDLVNTMIGARSPKRDGPADYNPAYME